MFRHKGKTRTYTHNLKLASLLSLVAGMVNIVGVLEVQALTTNVTGHFAYFSEAIFQKRYGVAVVYLLYILSFLAGAFVSNLLVEIVSRIKPQFSYAMPMVMEIAVLSFVGFLNVHNYGEIIAFALLFAMGLQNALVTKVSQSVVRTTHLTGLFTDLGIELSQLLFYKKVADIQRLSKSIILKLAIIGCFFSGCLVGGFAFKTLGSRTLLIASLVLSIALFYDNIIFYYYHLRRKLHHNRKSRPTSLHL